MVLLVHLICHFWCVFLGHLSSLLRLYSLSVCELSGLSLLDDLLLRHVHDLTGVLLTREHHGLLLDWEHILLGLHDHSWLHDHLTTRNDLLHWDLSWDNYNLLAIVHHNIDIMHFGVDCPVYSSRMPDFVVLLIKQLSNYL